MLCFHAAQTGKHLLRTQNVSEQNQKHFVCPQQMLRARANGETFQPRSHGLSSPTPKEARIEDPGNEVGNICDDNNVSATMCPRLQGPHDFDFGNCLQG